MTAPVLCSSVAIGGFLALATGHGKPLLGAIRVAVYARACFYMAASMIEGARLRLQRWPEMVQKSREEI